MATLGLWIATLGPLDSHLKPMDSLLGPLDGHLGPLFTYLGCRDNIWHAGVYLDTTCFYVGQLMPREYFETSSSPLICKYLGFSLTDFDQILM